VAYLKYYLQKNFCEFSLKNDKLNLEELHLLKQQARNNIIESFKKDIASSKVFDLIKLFDFSLYEKQINQSFEHLNNKIKILDVEIDNKILEKEKDELIQKEKKLEKEYESIFQEIEIAIKEKDEKRKKELEVDLIKLKELGKQYREKIEEIDIVNKKTEEHKKIEEQRLSRIKITKDFRQLCSKIELSFSELDKKRQDWQD
jgi:hypothetical protein